MCFLNKPGSRMSNSRVGHSQSIMAQSQSRTGARRGSIVGGTASAIKTNSKANVPDDMKSGAKIARGRANSRFGAIGEEEVGGCYYVLMLTVDFVVRVSSFPPSKYNTLAK